MTTGEQPTSDPLVDKIVAQKYGEPRTDFIVPGDIMRGLGAELRHRGYEVEKAEAYEMPERGLIIATALAHRPMVTDTRIHRSGWVVCVYTRSINEALVKSSTLGLDFTFEGEES